MTNRDTEKEIRKKDTEARDTDKEIKEKDTEVRDTDKEVRKKDTEVKDTDKEVRKKDTEVRKKDKEIKKKNIKVKAGTKKETKTETKTETEKDTNTKKRKATNTEQEDPARRRKMEMLLHTSLACFMLLFILTAAVGVMRRAKIHASEQARIRAEKLAALEQQAAEEVEASDAGTAEKPAEPRKITISVVGDCTLGTDESFDYETSVNYYYELYGPDYFMENVKDIFAADDLTIANFEGTLTYSEERADKWYAFKADPEVAKVLTSGRIEAVNTANNHSHDYGDASFQDTMDALDAEGIVHFGYEETAVVEVGGVKVGLVGTYELTEHQGIAPQMKANIDKVKSEGSEVTIVIVHWGNELDEEPDENQLALAHLAVDYGADLVCGHHAHVLQGIETYKGVKIAYGLGNFCFGGNVAPSDMDTIIFQETFTVTDEGVQHDGVTNIIPCSISSEDYYNDYRPTPQTGEEADRILQKLEERTSYI